MRAVAVQTPETSTARTGPVPRTPRAQQLIVRFDGDGEIHWMNRAARATFGAARGVMEVLTAGGAVPALVSLPLGNQRLWLGLAPGTVLSELAGRVNRLVVEIYCRRGWHNLQLLRARDLLQTYWAQTRLARASHQRTMPQTAIEIMAALEAERGRVARELHDEAGQSLTGVLLNLELVERQLGSANAEALVRLARSRELASLALDQIRNISHGLNPPQWEGSDFRSAAERVIETMSLRSRLLVEMDEVGPLEGVSPVVKTALYRALQEGLTNVVRHSGASQVRIQTHIFTDAVGLVIQDDGEGFDPAALHEAPNGIGLSNIRQRVGLLGGRLDISSAPGRGCQLSVFVPIRPQDQGRSYV